MIAIFLYFCVYCLLSSATIYSFDLNEKRRDVKLQASVKLLSRPVVPDVKKCCSRKIFYLLFRHF